MPVTEMSYDAVVLPPILEVHVVWHPNDKEGLGVFESLIDHFHGTTYSGLVGGAVEVYQRSEPWEDGAPRAIPVGLDPAEGVLRPRFVAIVPVLGPRLARAVSREGSAWATYLSDIAAVWKTDGVGVFPVRVDGEVSGRIGDIIGHVQSMAPQAVSDARVLCRELAQQIAQRVEDPLGGRLTVFISHTKRHSVHEEHDAVDAVVQRVRDVIASTHLAAYFDASEIQPGSGWDEELRENAAGSALLVVRTDLYAGREWCQREFLLAKQAGMPIVTLNAVRKAEERGSFLMDHVPAVGYQDTDDASRDASIEDALNLLVDGALRRAIWGLQSADLVDAGFDWLPLNAPEPATMIPWLIDGGSTAGPDGRVLVMHPDPPLGPDEHLIIEQLLELAGMTGTVDVLTPRTYASRGGEGS